MSTPPPSNTTAANLTNTTTPISRLEEFIMSVDLFKLKKWRLGLNSVLMCLGTPLNLWFLIAIVTAVNLRSKLGAQLACAILVTNIIKGTVVTSFELFYLSSFHPGLLHCSIDTLQDITDYTVDLMDSWYILIWLASYIVSLARIDLRGYLSPFALKISRIITLVGPGLSCWVIGPSVYAYHSHKLYGNHPEGCLFSSFDTFMAFSTMSLSVPFFIKVAIIPLILTLHFRLKRQEKTTTATLVGSRMPEVDSPVAYVTTCAICALTTFPLVLLDLFKLHISSDLHFVVFEEVSMRLHEFQVMFIPFCFLLLPEIRERIKTWRPWYRPASGIDLTIRYQKEDE